MNKHEFCELLEKIQPAIASEIMLWMPPCYPMSEMYRMARGCVDKGMVTFKFRRTGQEYSTVPGWRDHKPRLKAWKPAKVKIVRRPHSRPALHPLQAVWA